MVRQDGQLPDEPRLYQSKADSNLYFKVEGEKPVMLLLYVDDLFLKGEDELIKYARRRLATEFKMKDLGMMHYFLDMEVWYNADGIFPWSRKVCSGDSEEVQNDGMQGNGHTNGINLEATV